MIETALKFPLTAVALAGGFVLTPVAHAQNFELKSTDIAAGQTVPQTFAFNGFGCTGGNVSPALQWRHAPEGTKSIAVMVHDADAATGGAGFWHWVVVNLPPTLAGLPRGAGAAAGQALPEGVRQIPTDFGSPGWGGPCPPAGEKAHRYTFTAYALKIEKLELPANATASLTGFMVNMNSLAKASFTALYGR
jgi:Raf kinase inhibitor-like YbhB/YbcL family protein